MVDSYDIKTNVFNIDYFKKLVMLQRKVKEFLYKNKDKKIYKTFSKVSKKSTASMYSKFSDVQSIMSMQSNKISIRV